MKEKGTVEFTKEQLEKIAVAEKEFQEDTAVVSAAIQKYFDKHNTVICGVTAQCIYGHWCVYFTKNVEALWNKAIDSEENT